MTSNKRRCMEVAPDINLDELQRIRECPAGSNDNHLLFVAMCESANQDYATFPVRWWVIVEACKTHDVRARKDGRAIMFAEMRVGRRDEHARSVTALAYEIDGKLSIDEVIERVEASGYEALVWTTHNHLRTSQDIRSSSYDKWQAQVLGSAGTLTDETVRRYCQDENRYNHLTSVRLKDGGKIRRTVKYRREVDVFDIAHDAEHKTRIVFPLKTPFDLTHAGITKHRFKDYYHAHGKAVFGDTYSKESAPPASLHYGPSTPVKGRGVVKRIEGALLAPEDIDISEVVAEDEVKASRRAQFRSKLVGLKELAYVLEHIPSDLEYPDWFKAIAAIFHESRGSDEGNQLAHDWSSEDPRYDFDEVEVIWDSLSLDHDRPATMGTLVNLAKAYSKKFVPYRGRR